MRDIVPPEGELRRQVANRILNVYAAYGYEVVETPALEDLEVLVGSQGGENEKLIFKVLKRGAKLDEELERGGELADMGLRFDLTVPLARFVANHLNDLPMPFKVAHLAPVWRAERPQRGRFREFTQCDIDIEASIAAEIELCTATIEALQQIGIDGCTVRLNDRRLLLAAVEHHLGPLDQPGAVFIALDKLDKTSSDNVAAELTRAGHDIAGVERLLESFAKAELIGPPEGQDISVRFDPTLVRGMGYYTGQIFEVSHPDLPYSLAGGGRYDGMMARFGAPALAMCGFSIGFERVCELVDKNAFAAARAKIAVTCPDDEELLRCQVFARAKRDGGTVVNVVRRARNVRKQRDDLEKLGYSEVIDAEAFGR
jgi:histidyl-tRNA synthetase